MSGSLVPITSSRSLLLIDTNLLLVLVIAAIDADHIGRVRRTEAYTKDDAVLIGTVVGEFDGILLTPHILTEVSNLTGQIGGKLFDAVRESLARLIRQSAEYLERSSDVAIDSMFGRFGITDAGIRHASFAAAAVLSDDLPLCDALGRLGVNVINFTHLRVERMRET